MSIFKLFLLKVTAISTEQVLCSQTAFDEYPSEAEALNGASYILRVADTQRMTYGIKAVVVDMKTGKSRMFNLEHTPAEYAFKPV